nr:MAG TPA: Ciliary BBSome complex subunit 1 [Bacteriophage sp.]
MQAYQEVRLNCLYYSNFQYKYFGFEANHYLIYKNFRTYYRFQYSNHTYIPYSA